MALNYTVQPARYIIGTATTDATLTTAYSGNLFSFNTEGFTQLTLYVTYTGAENGRQVSLQVEGSPDGTTFYPVASVSDDSPFTGEAVTEDFIKKIDSDGTSVVRRRFLYDIADIYMRVSVKEDGNNFGSINIINLISGQ